MIRKSIKSGLFVAFLIFLFAIGCTQNNHQTLQEEENFYIRRISAYPFYEMGFYSDYEEGKSELANSESGFACSLFSAQGDGGEIYMGRNFDWDHSPALLLRTFPLVGFCSISMVNLDFLGISPDEARNLLPLTDANQEKILRAPFLPVDGMNEAGLAVGMAAVPYSQDNTNPENPGIGSLEIIRELLDHAAGVDEAIEIMASYTIDFGGGPPIHYLITDMDGRSVMVEYGSGWMHVIESGESWNAATNFLLEGTEENAVNMCDRYCKITTELEESGGIINQQSGMGLLSSVSQGNPPMDGTQWSALYALRSGELLVSLGRDYSEIFHFSLVKGN